MEDDGAYNDNGGYGDIFMRVSHMIIVGHMRVSHMIIVGHVMVMMR
jgi:hypothetical protein